MDLADKDIKATILNIFKEWKKTMFHKLKKNMTGTQQISNWNKKYKLKRELNRNSRFENMVTEMKNSLGELYNLPLHMDLR